MTKKLFFTVNLLIKSDFHLQKTIDSIIGDGKFFRDNVQLILIDSIGSDNSVNACSRYNSLYPDNIWFVDAAEKNIAESYNGARPVAVGDYISFIDNYSSFSENALPAAMKLLGSGKIPALAMKPLCAAGKGATIPYIDDLQKGINDINDTPDRINLMLGSYLFRRISIDGISFQEGCGFHSGALFIIEALLRIGSYVYTDGFSHITAAATERDPIRYKPQYSTSFYTRSVRKYLIPLLKEAPGSAWVQSAVMYLIGVKLALNSDELDKGVLNDNALDEFLSSVADALRFIDDTVIINKRICRSCGLDTEMPFRLLRLKYKDPDMQPELDIIPPKESVVMRYYTAPNRMEAITMSGEFAAHINRVLITMSTDINARILAINSNDKNMTVDAVLDGCSCLNENEYEIFLVSDHKKQLLPHSRIYTTRMLFGRPFLRRCSFRLTFPFSSGKKMDTFSISLKIKNLIFRIGMTFGSIYSKLSDEIHSSYFISGDRHISYDTKTRSIIIRSCSETFASISESRFLREAAKNYSLSAAISARHIRRTANGLSSSSREKKIILFFEENGINYNGNLLFRYFYKNKSELFEPYFCTSHGSHDSIFLKDNGYDNIIETGTSKAKAISLAADIIFSSSIDPYKAVGFTPRDEILLRDLIRARTISIKNYMLTWHSAASDNRIHDNTRLVFCSSEREKKNLLSPAFDYSEEMIKITGIPLFDACADKHEKLIVFAPGERRLSGIYESSDSGSFSNSDFCRECNAVINDSVLLTMCRSKGWKIALLLPGSVSKYSALFSENDIVSVYTYSEQNEASLALKGALLVTDHNEIQYRFAYTGRSVIYYFPPGMPQGSEHPGENPARYGFGKIFTDHVQLCKYLVENADAGFEPEQKYFARANEFFHYKDKGNCRRIFEATIDYLK